MAINYPLIPPPTPATRTLKMGSLHATALVQSPFTLQQQVQQWDGEMWTLTAGLPIITSRAIAAPWIAFKLALRGKTGTFLFGDPNGKAPMGNAGGVPMVKGAGQLGTQLIVRNWTPSIAGILKAGDYIQLSKNYLFAPIAFDDASWTKNQLAAITPNTIVAPDGASTADALVPSAATDAFVLQTPNPLPPTLASRLFSFSVWLKVPSSTKTINISIADNIGSSALSVTITTAWQLFTVTRVLDPGATTVSVKIGGANTWTAGEIDAWGAGLSSQQVDARLHQVLTDAASDSSGNATLDIFPRLRELTTDFARIYTANPVGAWRMADNTQSWDLDQALTYGIDFSAMEAL